MSLHNYIRFLVIRWYLVVFSIVAGGTIAAVYVSFTTPTFTANSQLFVSTAAQTSLSDLSAGGTFVQDQVKSYASVATTPTLLAPMIMSLHLPYSTGQLASEITASAPADTVLINLTVQDGNAARAAAIADSLAERLTYYIAQLETPAGQDTSPVKATVTQTASTPDAPSSPNRTLDLVLGLAVGLLVGASAAIAVELLDNRVSGQSDIPALVGTPNLGTIAEDPQARTKPLILLDNAFSKRAEAFRQLRTNIRFLSVDRNVQTFVVTGSVENEGKSLTASNLAIALAQSGESVVLVDGDLRRPSLAATFGLHSTLGLTNVLVENTALEDAVQVWRADLPLRILTSGPIPPNPSELLGSQRLIDIVNELKTANIVIFDSPPLLPVTDAALLARATDGALIVTRARSTRLSQLAAASAALRAADATILGVVINREAPRGRARSGYIGYSSYPSVASDSTAIGLDMPPTPASSASRTSWRPRPTRGSSAKAREDARAVPILPKSRAQVMGQSERDRAKP